MIRNPNEKIHEWWGESIKAQLRNKGKLMKGFVAFTLVIILFYLFLVIKDTVVDKCSDEYIPYAENECLD
ncbi:MAG: hypothetical protein ACPGKG_08625 [Paracoccaceae bacterium]